LGWISGRILREGQNLKAKKGSEREEEMAEDR
jgi:hypothetical protein